MTGVQTCALPISVKDSHTSSTAERAMATKLLEVIDELEKAHQTFEEKAIRI